MGFFDLFRRKTDDERELEEVNKRAREASRAMEAARAAEASKVVPATGAPRMSLKDTAPTVIQLLSEDRKMMAIKYVKDNTGVGLKEAKDFVETFEQKVHVTVGAAATENVPDDVVRKVKELLADGRKIEAVKLVKDSTTTMGLKECKDFVERFE